METYFVPCIQTRIWLKVLYLCSKIILSELHKYMSNYWAVVGQIKCFSSVTLQGSVQLDSINQNNRMFIEMFIVYWMFIYFIIEYSNLRNWNKTNPSLGLASVCMDSHLLFSCRRLLYSKVFFSHTMFTKIILLPLQTVN